MAKRFLATVFLVLLVYSLLSGLITAEDNTGFALTGKHGDRIYLEDLTDLINFNFETANY